AVCQRRSTRAGRRVVREMGKFLEMVVQRGGHADAKPNVPFAHAEAVVQRMGWCRLYGHDRQGLENLAKLIPLPGPHDGPVAVPLLTLAEPAENVLIASSAKAAEHDDDELPLPALAYGVLLALPLDLRAICLSRIVVTTTSGPGSRPMPGLKERLMAEINQIIGKRGWDPVASYGGAKAPRRALHALSSNTLATAPTHPPPDPAAPPRSPTKKALRESLSLPPHQRPHDNTLDPISLKAERNHFTGRHVEGAKPEGVRGVETVGAWAGASLVASLRVKGVHEVEREEWLRGGWRDGGVF
ncbi:hypothetical protein LTR53_016759, partial [Teratosphaeriaceae sp. CCFEE 6253]